MAVLTVTCCSGQPLTAARHAQKFEREPEDQTAVVGETVVMACRVINKSGVLQWTKDDFGLGSDRNLSGFERYSMIGTEDEGTCFCALRNSFMDFSLNIKTGAFPITRRLEARSCRE